MVCTANIPTRCILTRSYFFRPPRPTQKKFSGSSPSFKIWMVCVSCKVQSTGIGCSAFPGKKVCNITKIWTCTVSFGICHMHTDPIDFFSYLFSQSGLIRVSLATNPHINYTIVVLAVKGHLEDVAVEGRNASYQLLQTRRVLPSKAVLGTFQGRWKVRMSELGMCTYPYQNSEFSMVASGLIWNNISTQCKSQESGWLLLIF